MWSVVKNLDPPLDIIPRSQSTTCFKNKNKLKVTSRLTYIFEIGAEESSLVIIPNYNPLKGSLLS